jgi:hypothetical protein
MGSMLLKMARRAEREKRLEEKKLKPKVKAKTRSKATAEGLRTAEEGRRQVALHERPPLKKAILTVLGSKEMTTMQVISLLRSRNWLPLGQAEQNVRVALCMMARDQEGVKRVRRGLYRASVY